MRAALYVAVSLAVSLWMIAMPACAAAGDEAVEVTLAELLSDWQELDGREVIFRGEAIGDVMRRGDYAWVTINDDFYSREARLESGELRGGNSGIGVWLPAGEAEKIEVLGRFGTVGDFVEVRGVFYADCPQHGGDLDIHAISLTVLDRGKALDSGLDGAKCLAAVFAGVFMLGTFSPFLRRRAREIRSARALLRKEEE